MAPGEASPLFEGAAVKVGGERRMRKKGTTVRPAACLVLVALFLAPVLMACDGAPGFAIAGDVDRRLFRASDVAGELDTGGRPTVIRSRFVDVRLELLGDLDAPAERVVLNLFDDAVYTAVYDRTETNYLGSFVWVGHLEGVEASNAILTLTDGVMAGSFTTPDAIYQVRYAGNGVYAVDQIDQSRFPPEMEPVPAGTP
jgi:hypothetical protein